MLLMKREYILLQLSRPGPFSWFKDILNPTQSGLALPAKAYPFRAKKWDFWIIFLVIKSNDAMELAGVTVRLWNGEQIQPLFVPFVNQITHRFRHLPFSLENNDSFKSIFMFSHKNRNNIMFLGTISLISIKITWTLKHLKSLYKDPTRCLYSPLWRV